MEDRLIKILKFGSPKIQSRYKELCQLSGVLFDDFQLKLINDTGRSYDELKNYWISGDEVLIESEKLCILNPIYLSNYFIIHFDLDKKDILGITLDNYQCLTDEFEFYENFKITNYTLF